MKCRIVKDERYPEFEPVEARDDPYAIEIPDELVLEFREVSQRFEIIQRKLSVLYGTQR